VRYGKDHVSVRYPEHISSNLFSPSYRVSPAAGWTKAVFTIVIYFGSIPAIWTGIDVYSKSCCPACPYILNSFVLFGLNKVFWMFAVLIPPEVKESGKAIFFFAKPVMLLRCMNSTFTHAAIVFVRTSSTTPGSGPKANTKIQVKSEPVFKKKLFSGLDFA
jgi:hypothetical protein